MQVTIADRIREVLPTLPRAERRVGLALLRQYPVAGLETVARLAESAEVSGPTVLRFVTRLGYDGFPSFQQSLLAELGDRRASPLLQYDQAPSSSADAVERARTVLSEAVEASLRHLDRAAYDQSVAQLTTARRVFTTGGRFSDLAAIALSQHLDILRPGVRHLTEDMRVSYLMSAKRGDVVVVFDVRRYQRSSIDFGREALLKGAEIILVTDPWLSPLAMDASYVLSVGVEGPSPFDTQVPVMALVEAIVASATEALGDRPKARLAEYDRLWDEQQFRYPDIDPPLSEVLA
jgi:DNA-binding MurR/RpiR family transcriptional regulator